MGIKRLIQILALVFVVSMISNISFAEHLRCEQDFPKIKRLFLHETNILARGSFEELIKYYQQAQYDRLFKVQHPGKVFFKSKWIDEPQYKQMLQDAFESYQNSRFRMTAKVSQPLNNFFVDGQELCIVEVKYITDVVIEPKLLTQTHILVRKQGRENWRWFYISDELKEKDFREFFPHFPSNVVIKELPYTKQ